MGPCKKCGSPSQPLIEYLPPSWWRRLFRLRMDVMRNRCIWCDFIWYTAPKTKEDRS